MKLTIEITDEQAQENVSKMWANGINVTKVVNDCLANLQFDIKCTIKPFEVKHKKY